MANIGSGGGTGYPSAIDTQSPPESGSTLARSDVPNDLAAAVISIETELGTTPSGSASNVKAFLLAEHKDDGSHGDITPTKIINEGDFLFAVGASVPSASALVLGDGTIFDVTGTVTIDSISTKGVGGYIILSFSAVVGLVDDDDNLKLGVGGGGLITRDGTTIALYEYAVGKWRLVGFNHSSPPPIGNFAPNTIQALTYLGMFGTTINEFSTDGTLADDSDDAVPTEQAVRTFVEARGKVLQMVFFSTSAALSTTAIIPRDSTIPQIGEGLEVMTVDITPKDIASNLIIESSVFGAAQNTSWTIAMFKDVVNDAIAVAHQTIQAVGVGGVLNMGHTEASVDLTTKTFSVRIGDEFGTTFFNQNKDSETLGSTSKSFIKIIEVLP